MQLALGVVDAVALAQRIETVALARMQAARQRQRVEHLADRRDGARIAGQARELGVEETDVERRVVNDELGAADEREQLVGDLGELRRLLQPRELDAVHGQRAGVDLALGIQVAMEFLARRPAIERFPRSRFR